MRLTWKRGALGILGLVVLGAVVVVSGIVPVAASTEHWPVTRWFLEFAMSRSVATHSLGTTVPDLDDPAMVVRGAGHFEAACSTCHGRPGAGRSQVVLEMTPHPPTRAEFTRWDAAELFYIVRHGVKFTAMPAWPVTGREDEVWAMVAFLRVLPELDEESYLTLAYGEAPSRALGPEGGALIGPSQALDPDLGDDGPEREAPRDPPLPLDGDEDVDPDELDVEVGVSDSRGSSALVDEIVARSCSRCHGTDGSGRGLGAAPTLAGQRSAYLERSLGAYATGIRRSGTMHVVASALPPETLASLSSYFERQGRGGDVLVTAPPDEGLVARIRELLYGAGSGEGEAGGGSDEEEPGSVPRGRELARTGNVGEKIPSCVDCHGPLDRPRNPDYPLLAGQYREYLVGQLELFRSGVRTATEYGEVMHTMVGRMSDEEIGAVAAYYASLGNGEDDPGPP